jgi:mono/diheme cytochrome c family protein
VAGGKGVYERHCQRCHGPGGWGDGPDAGSLTVRPTNFHLFRSYLKSDDELQRVIEHGVVFSPMHAWQGQLTENEIQDVLAYVRFLSQQSR